MNKLLLSLALVFSFSMKTLACADGGDEDSYYYNLFNQSLVNSPQYQPFLLTYDNPYYDTSDVNMKDEKIEDWANYLGVSYNDALNLVYKVSKKDIDNLLKTNKSNHRDLKFVNADFIKKHKQALLYLSYAKYLEPYMMHNYIDTGDSWSYVDRSGKKATNLDDQKVMNVLLKSYQAETDPELKMRYGYQMVRFAHYTNQYNQAIQLFNKYVVPLNIKSVMYYYALDQKAGAERAVGNYMQANYDFFEVFSHTKNRKESAYNSMKVTQDLDFDQMLKKAKTNQEKIDLYLLIGYKEFSNPLAAIRQIIKLNPNAEQAKVLYARAINSIEREYLNQYQNGNSWSKEKIKAQKLPAFSDSSSDNQMNKNFIQEVIALGKEQANKSSDKDFWNLSVAYLSTLIRDFNQTKTFLAKVNNQDSAYALHKKMIEMLMDLNQQDQITPAYEKTILTKYGDILDFELVYPDEYDYGTKIFSDEELLKSRFKDLAKDILANRYFLQGDRAKAFLMHNSIYDLATNVDVQILKALDELDKKKNKNDFEQYLVSNIFYDDYDPNTYKYSRKKSKFTLADFIANYKGTLYLKERKFDLAKAEFEKIPKDFTIEETSYYSEASPNSYNWFSNISDGIFGYNKIECFNCSESDVMVKPYLSEFKFIKPKMNKLELTEALIELNKIGRGKNERAVKADYLLANFYFNTTALGYFRELLSFDRNNENGPKFHDFTEQENEGALNSLVYVNYYKNYGWNAQYINNFNLSLDYAKLALKNVSNPELKAQILFTASKAEQGLFYTYVYNNVSDNVWYVDYDEDKLISLKKNQFRNYFKELKSLANTQMYKDIKSNCLYFNTYIN